MAEWRLRSPTFSCTITPQIPLEGELRSPTIRRQLYVGVMTARKLLHTRATAINQTWGKYAPKLEFYVASPNLTTGPKRVQSSDSSEPLPLILLPGISDGYPPLTKFFRMLEYMAEHYIEEFNWFMRADDDSYVRMPELLDFLHQLDSSKNLYIGAPGVGRPEDLGLIQLYTNELYCLGGPGTLFSRTLLKKLAPHLEECLAEATSYHDDAEVGKCISRRIGIQCTSSNEVSSMGQTTPHDA